jgi:hypothetical protein
MKVTMPYFPYLLYPVSYIEVFASVFKRVDFTREEWCTDEVIIIKMFLFNKTKFDQF